MLLAQISFLNSSQYTKYKYNVETIWDILSKVSGIWAFMLGVFRYTISEYASFSSDCAIFENHNAEAAEEL